MKQKLNLLLLPLLLYTTDTVYAQITKKIISGKVISFEESFPLEGVSVQVKGTQNNTGTMADGVYQLQLDGSDSVLLFSLPGYEKQEIRITRAASYDVVLKRKENSNIRQADISTSAFTRIRFIPIKVPVRQNISSNRTACC